MWKGLRWDAPIGKIYMRNRFYDPVTGRFMSRDPLGVHTDAGNMGNEYAYAWMRPLVVGDPLGLQATQAQIVDAMIRSAPPSPGEVKEEPIPEMMGPEPPPGSEAHAYWEMQKKFLLAPRQEAARARNRERLEAWARTKFQRLCIESMKKGNPTSMVRHATRREESGVHGAQPDGKAGTRVLGFGAADRLWIEVKCSRSTLYISSNENQIEKHFSKLKDMVPGAIYLIIKTSDATVGPDIAERAAELGIGLEVAEVTLGVDSEGRPTISVNTPTLLVPPRGINDRRPAIPTPRPFGLGGGAPVLIN